jgi:hypothetical protein
MLDNVIEKMHAEAGEYHRHFSEARTHTTSLFVPIALLDTIEMFKDCQHVSWIVLFCFIAFVVATMLFINVVFWGWSLYQDSLIRTHGPSHVIRWT